MNRKRHELDIPSGFEISKHEFYQYNPETDYNVEEHLFYLQEDLFQLIFEPRQLIIDLGWYGETNCKEGEFKIYVIKNSNWDKPLLRVSSSSGLQIKKELNLIIDKVYGGLL